MMRSVIRGYGTGARLAAAVLLIGAAVCAGPKPAVTPKQTRARFVKLLERPRLPVAPESRAEPLGDLTQERGQFTSEAGQRVPFVVLKPARAAGRLPAVIVLHGTGGNKGGVADFSKDLAARGILAIAIDARYHGDRVPGGARGSQEYQDAIIRAWQQKEPARQEHPLYYDTVYDIWRSVDYLETRPDVDRLRIGIMGFSMGGIQAWLAAAGDERLRVVVPAIAVQSFRWSLDNGQWQGRARTVQRAHEVAAKDLGEPGVNAAVCRALWHKILPGILDEYDGPQMLRAIAPRPLLIVNGEKDPNCPIEGARLAFAAAEQAYRGAKAEDRLKIDVAAGVAHAVTPEQRQMALDWFVRWLQPAPTAPR